MSNIKRDNIKIKVFCNDVNYEVPEEPDKFFSYFQDKLDLIPNEFKKTAKIEIEAESDYDSGRLYLTVSYTRPETNEEMAIKKKKEKDRKEFVENQELCKLEELRKKYNV